MAEAEAGPEAERGGRHPLMINDLTGPLHEKYPDRDVCERCLMTFAREPAPTRAGPERCPVCSRVFWCVVGRREPVRCYTIGRRI